MEFMEYVVISDTFQMHDTLLVKEDLVKNPSKFY